MLPASVVLAAAVADSAGQTLLPGARLLPGQWLTGGAGVFMMCADGDLAVCKDSTCEKRLWGTNTGGHPGAYALMQEFGVLSVFPANTSDTSLADVRLWQSHTMAKAGCTSTSTGCAYLTMQANGDAVLRKGAGPANAGPTLWSTGTTLPPAGARNVLYMIADDLRPEMNLAYHQKDIVTPNFDRLARTGLVFDRAYCQIAVCAPSRNSFMSGLRPDVTAIYNFGNHIREMNQPGITTLPQTFKNAGWTTLGGGKTFHISLPPDWDQQHSWTTSVQPYYPFWEYGGSSDFAECPNKASACAINGSMEQLYDYRLASHTIATLKTVAAIDAPWFVMAGFRRPHRDFLVHQQYWDMYPDPWSGTMHTARHQHRDPSQPEVAFHAAGCTLPNGTTIPGDADRPWPIDVQQWFRTGYYAAVSQTDAQVGRVLDALDELKLAESTVVVMHADHGWQLGEHGLWDKQTEFELATRVPLIIRAPWKTASVGQHTASLTELVDLHPTVQALAGISHPTPPTQPQFVPPGSSGAQGASLAALFDDPSASLKNHTLSQFPNCGISDTECMACTGPRSFRTSIAAMGYSVRTDMWRYTTYVPFNNVTFTGDFSAEPLGEELYDHRGSARVVFDMDDDGEAVNLVHNASVQDVLQDMRELLHASYSYPASWLAQRHKRFLAGQENYALHMGWAGPEL